MSPSAPGWSAGPAAGRRPGGRVDGSGSGWPWPPPGSAASTTTAPAPPPPACCTTAACTRWSGSSPGRGRPAGRAGPPGAPWAPAAGPPTGPPWPRRPPGRPAGGWAAPPEPLVRPGQPPPGPRRLAGDRPAVRPVVVSGSSQEGPLVTTPRRRAAPLPRGGSRWPGPGGRRRPPARAAGWPRPGGRRRPAARRREPGVGLVGQRADPGVGSGRPLEVAAGHCRRGLQPGGWGVDRARQLDQLTSSPSAKRTTPSSRPVRGGRLSPCSARIASTSSALAAASPRGRRPAGRARGRPASTGAAEGPLAGRRRRRRRGHRPAPR